MSKKHRLPSRAVGYIRVSTQRQESDGLSLEAQSGAIREYAKQHHIEVTRIFEDTSSGVGVGVLMRNQGLSDAIKLAKSLGAPLLITDLSRVARSAKVINKIYREDGVSLLIVNDGYLLGKSALELAATKAQSDAERISRTTKQALAKKKAAGAKLGNRTNLGAAQRQGAITNLAHADAKVEEILQILRTASCPSGFTAAEVAELLNARGVRTRRGLSWTVEGMRRPLRKARAAFQREIDDSRATNPNFGRF